MYIAFSKSTPDSIIEQWQRNLDEIKSDGTYAQIFSQWIMFSYTTDLKPQIQKKLNLTTEEKLWRDTHPVIRVAIDPDYARAYHMRGLVGEKQGDHEAALADFDKAIDLNPEYGAAYYSRATLHSKLANTEKAQDDIEMVAHLQTRNVESFMSENNVWHTQHMRVEDALETELER